MELNVRNVVELQPEIYIKVFKKVSICTSSIQASTCIRSSGGNEGTEVIGTPLDHPFY